MYVYTFYTRLKKFTSFSTFIPPYYSVNGIVYSAPKCISIHILSLEHERKTPHKEIEQYYYSVQLSMSEEKENKPQN